MPQIVSLPKRMFHSQQITFIIAPSCSVMSLPYPLSQMQNCYTKDTCSANLCAISKTFFLLGMTCSNLKASRNKSEMRFVFNYAVLV